MIEIDKLSYNHSGRNVYGYKDGEQVFGPTECTPLEIDDAEFDRVVINEAGIQLIGDIVIEAETTESQLVEYIHEIRTR